MCDVVVIDICTYVYCSKLFNYRSVTLNSIVCNTLEKFIRDHVFFVALMIFVASMFVCCVCVFALR